MTGRHPEQACVVTPAALAETESALPVAAAGSRLLGLIPVLSVAMLAIWGGALDAGSASAAPAFPAPKPAKLSAEAPTASVATRLRTLDRLLAKTGIDLQRLVASAGAGSGALSEGEGGPLVPALGRGSSRAVERQSMAELDRLRRMETVLLAVPLATPMAEYKLNSGFGYRRDPFRHRGAMHTGLDFGGARNAPVAATAPGKVIEAGRSGAYGIMVVVDHGMGIETRYAHLSRALVRVGDEVALGKTVGLMGRTGRATGPHLHYEIRLDGRPLNPKPFIEAGIQLAAH